MTKPTQTVGARFSNRLTAEADTLINEVLTLTSGSGWDVDRTKISGALPHDLRTPNGWDILRVLETLRIPFALQDEPPVVRSAQPVLRIRSDASWTVHKDFSGVVARHQSGSQYAYVQDVDSADLLSDASALSEVFRALKPTLLSLLVSSLIVNLLGITTVVFVILIYNFAVPSESLSVLLAILVGLTIFTAIELIARRIRSSALVRLAADLEHRMGISLVYKLLSLPLNVVQGSDVYQQRSRLRQFEGMRDALLGPLGQAALDLPFLVIYAIIVFALSPAACFVVVGGGLLGLAIFAMFQPGLKERLTNSSRANTDYTKQVAFAVQNQSSIRGLGVEQIWRTRLETSHQELLSASLEAQRQTQLSAVILQSFVMATGISAGALATYQAITGAISLGALVGMVVLVWRFLMPFQSIAQGAEQLQGFLQSKQDFNEAFSLESEAYRGVAPKVMQPVLPPVVFDQVTLRFSDSIVPPLLGVSFRLETGTVTSVSGPGMSGKTKLAELISGLYAPTGGQVMINGADVRQIPVDDLRSAIAFAPQYPQAFYGSIAQNFDFAVPGVSDELMWQALLEAGIDGYVRKLPDGLATRLSTTVFRSLPYGVQKGLSLAQCFLKSGPIFIFDDPLFGTDPDQHVFVRSAIRARRGRGAVLLISNDGDDLDIADRHILLDKGRVILNERASRARPRIEALLNRNASA